MAYTFTCPLEGCNHTIMTSNAANPEDAKQELTKTAENHLSEKHPDIHKTHEEVTTDIASHMAQG